MAAPSSAAGGSSPRPQATLRAISHRAAFSTVSLFELSQATKPSL